MAVIWLRPSAGLVRLAATVFWAATAPAVVAQGSVESDRAALEAFYDATGGPDWADSTNWNTDAPLGEWYGVTTDADGRVTRLSLQENGLSGSIPSSVGDLSNLTRLLLGRNELSGPIPSSLGNLSDLTTLWLGNGLSGRIPSSLGNLSNLENLSLSQNELSGPIPSSLGNLSNLRYLYLHFNELSGRIPSSLGNLSNLDTLDLAVNDLSGPIPAELGSLVNLRHLGLTANWGLSGPLPSGVRLLPRLALLDIFVTQTCAPAAWRDHLKAIEFVGRLCGSGADAIIDVAVVYTPAAREAEGGTAAIEALIDLLIARSNEVFASSGLQLRLELVYRSEVAYDETGTSVVDMLRLVDPADGFLDEVHAMRDRVGADLVSLMVGESDVCGRVLGRAFSLTVLGCAFTHELGHNLGLSHERYQVHHHEGGARAHPAYGYVNQRAFETGAPESSCWSTIMAYGTQCRDAGLAGGGVGRFSNARQEYGGDPLGVPYTGGGESGVMGPADAVAVLNVTGPAVALLRDRPAGLNRAPTAAGTLPDRRLTLDGALDVDVSQAFVDPDGDPLTYAVSSSSPGVVTVMTVGARLTLTAVGEGTAAIRVTATDPGGLSATQSFTVTVSPPANRPPEPVRTLAALTIGLDEPSATVDVSGAFRDPDGDWLSYGVRSSSPSVVSVSVLGSQVTVTPLSEGTALVTVTATDTGGSNTAATQSFAVTVVRPFTDHPIVPGETPVRAVHFTELRSRIDGLRVRAGLGRFAWTDPVLRSGVTRVRLVHLLELRSALAEAYSAVGQPSPSWTEEGPVAGTTPIRAAHLMELRAAVLEIE